MGKNGIQNCIYKSKNVFKITRDVGGWVFSKFSCFFSKIFPKYCYFHYQNKTMASKVDNGKSEAKPLAWSMSNQLTRWVDTQAVWYCVGSRSGPEGEEPAPEEKGMWPESLQKTRVVWRHRSGMFLLCSSR